jgi:hypothetical protein
MKVSTKMMRVLTATAVAWVGAGALLSWWFFRCGNTALPAVSDTFPPAVPAVVSATPTRCGAVTLVWNKAYDVHSVLKTYRIYKGGVLLAETHGTPPELRANTRQFTATGLPNGTALNFGVSAVDIYNNESAQAAFPAVTTPASNDMFCTDTTPPTAPSGFTVTGPTPGACRTVAIALSGPSTDGQSGIDRYRIYRDGVRVAETTTGNYGAERFGLVPNQTYDYWETAVDKAGNESVRGNVVHYTVPDCASVVAGGNLKTLILAVNLPGRPAPAVTMGDIEVLAFGWDPVILARPARAFRTVTVPVKTLPPDSIFNQPNMKAFYKEETYGRVNLTKAGVIGWIQLGGNINQYCPQFTSAGVGFNCNQNKIMTDAKAAAAAQFGWNPNMAVDRFIYVVNGQAENKTGGNTVMLSDFDLGTAIHEMGHTFSIEHAASWMGRKFDTPVGAQLALPLDFADLPFGAFDLSEYGDPRDRMGGPPINHFSSFQKELMGTLPASQVAHASYDTNFTLDAVEIPSTGVKELRIPVRPGAPTGKAPFVIAEYRNGRGYDGQSPRGVQLRLVPERFFGAGSDTMFVGEVTDQKPVFIDWHRGMKYTLVSADDTHAVLGVCGLGWDLVVAAKDFLAR